MKVKSVLYVHDHKFKYINNKYFSEGKFTNDVFARYGVFDKDINVISRVVCDDESINFNEINKPNVHFTPVKGIGFSSIFSKNLIFNLKLVQNSIKNAEALIIRLPSFLGVFVLLVNLLFRKKYFIELVGDPKEALSTSKVKANIVFNIFVYIFTFLNKIFVRHANGVIYVTKTDLQQRYPTRGFEASASNVQIKVPVLNLCLSDYAIKNTNFIKLGLIGSFNNEYKGIRNAIEAIVHLREKQLDVHLHILGSGKLKLHYLHLAKELGISDQIFFDGSLAGGEQVLQWLRQQDIYIQPSLTEGLPRALIEAMSVGLPAVGTNVGGIPELLLEDDLVAVNDSEALADRLYILAVSQELRYKKGRRNHKVAWDYDADKLNQERTQFWKKAAEVVNGKK